jgi:hypothetical protein
MSANKVNTLLAHIERHKQMLAGPVPPKHSKRVGEWKSYIAREIAVCERSLEQAKFRENSGKGLK